MHVHSLDAKAESTGEGRISEITSCSLFKEGWRDELGSANRSV